MSRAFFAVSAALLTAIVAAVACQDFPPIQLCGQIPGQGCPLGRGGTCDDPTCTGLYDCVGGHWVLSQACPVSDAGPPEAGADGGPGADAGPCPPVLIDAGNEGFGCTPDLQGPFDCPFALASCAAKACFTGCSDFFFCSAGPCGGGPGPCWVDVAYCDDMGNFIVTSP